MKFLPVFLIPLFLQLPAIVYPQDPIITLEFNTGNLSDLIQAIESQSDFRIFYRTDQVDIRRTVILTKTQGTIMELLSDALKGSEITYQFLEKLIVLTSTGVSGGPLKITGTVSDYNSGSPLPGVNILIEGTPQGVISDALGRFSLVVPNASSFLLFSYVGYVSQRIEVGGNSVLDIALVQDIRNLEEVVVIGYGTRSQRDVTTAISTLEAETIEKEVYMSPEMAMQGRMAGVQISGNGGNPMMRPVVRIRGVNTWGVAEPLYVVDGILITEFGSGIEGLEDARASDVRGPINIMSMIDPNDIESISVLKDASAAAIYGVRAANGVILITTKKGRGDKAVAEFNTRFGIQNLTQKIDVLNTPQYADHIRAVYASDPTLTVDPLNTEVFNPNSPAYLGNEPTYDWQEAVKHKNATMQDYSFRLSGGTSKTDYYFSMSYTNTQGTLIGSNLKRYYGSVKINTQVKKWFRTGVNYHLSAMEGSDNDDLITFWLVAQTPPWQPVFDPGGPGGYAPSVEGIQPDGTYSSDKLYGTGTRINLAGLLALNDDTYKSLRHMGTVYMEVEPWRDLTIKGQVSLDNYTHYRYQFTDYRSSVFDYTAGDPRSKGGGNSVGSYGEREVFNNNLITEITVNYTRSFSRHHMDVLFNGMNQQYSSKYNSMSTDYMTTTLWYLRKLGGENKYTSVGSDIGRWALSGLLGRLGYNYNSKYYFDFTLRHDGSARFSPENRWGTFPALSVAWRLSAEPFTQHLKWINDLKLRAGWGQLGNQEVRNMAYLSPISTNPTYAWGNDPGNTGMGYFSTAATVFALANPDLQWEKTSTTNVGLDAVVFNNLKLTVEYYNKYTSGILQEVSLPNSAGVTQQPVDNIASVRNMGIEIELGYSVRLGDLRINTGANLTTVKNRVEKTYKDIPLWDIEVGYPIHYIRGYRVGGIFQTQEELDSWKARFSDANYQTPKVAPGDMYFDDVRSAPKGENGFYSNEPDGIINNYDQIYLGKTIPGFYYGINLDAAWRGFDVGLQLAGVGDVQKINVVAANLESTYTTDVNVTTRVYSAWTPENKSKVFPRVIGGDPAKNFRTSDRFVESAAYLRLANLQLGYTLPDKVYNLTGNNLDHMRIYVGTSNLFTLTKYTGLDPENDKYPAPRVIFMGCTVRF